MHEREQNEIKSGSPGRPRSFWLNDWHVRPSLNQLASGETLAQVEPKVMEVLVCLAEANGAVVSKDEFMDRVWEGTVVTNDVLSRCISELRKTFNDSASNPQYIETIRKSGYRLLVPPEYKVPEESGRVASTPAVLSESAVSSQSNILSEANTTVTPGKPGDKRRMVGWGVGVGGLAIAGVAIAMWLGNQPVAPMQVMPFTTFPGVELDPAISPDGEHVAFVWNGGAGEDFDLYLKQIGGEKPLRLTDIEGDERSPTWSTDGRQLAFIRTIGNTISLNIIPTLGGSEREIVRYENREIQEVKWSPSGKYLAISAQRAPFSSFSLYLISTETLNIRELTRPPDYHYGDLYPAFSEDESKIAFVRSIMQPAQDIFMVDVESGEVERLTRMNQRVGGLDWDHEKDELLFSSAHDGISGIWNLSPGGGEPEWIVTGGMLNDVRQPSISRAGNKLMVEQHSSDTNIWQLRRSRQPEQLIASTRWESSPAISSDGEKIAFVSNQSGNYEVWVSDQYGENAYQLTRLEAGFISMPVWSPGDSLIAFVSWHEGDANVYLVETAGGQPRRFTNSQVDEISPKFSVDGQWLYYASNQNDVWQLRKAGLHTSTDTIQVSTEQAIAGMESSDGSSIFIVKPYDAGIWEIKAGSDSSELVISDFMPSDKYNWDVVDQGIYYVERSGAVAGIGYFSLITRRTSLVASLDSLPRMHSFAVAPDGTWFLYAKEEDIESDILLLEEEDGG